jgi:hypothetical protein
MLQTFYANPNNKKMMDNAVAVCFTCPVVMPCQQWALANHEEHGVWGGMTPEQRLRMIGAKPKRAATVSCGTSSGYVKGCRCDQCRQAHTAAVREYRQRQRANR